MNINASYLNQLSAFTKFANERINDNDQKAVATIDKQAGGNVQSITKNASDKPYAFTRTDDNKQSNNVTRALFMNTVANLFGGADKIPQSVKDQMELKRFDGEGRPLTARRINYVKNAILAVIKQSPDAGVSEGDALLILNGHPSYVKLAEPDDEASNNVANSINSVDDNIIKEEEDNNIINTSMKEEPKIEKQPKTNVNVSLNPNTFGGKLKMFQKSGVVFGQAGFVSGQGNRVMNGLSTGPKIVKEEKKEGENIVDNIEKQMNDIQVLQKRKPKKINPNFIDE